MKTWLYLCILLYGFSINCMTSTSYAASLQQSEIMLQIHNNTEQIICYILISNIAMANPDEVQQFEVNIATGETDTIALIPDNYNLVLVGCDGNALLLRRNLSIKQDVKLSLSQSDIEGMVCEAYNQGGIAAYLQHHYEEALQTFQIALSCLHLVGNYTGEDEILNNIGGVYHAQGQYSKALTSYKQALSIRRKIGDRIGEGETLDNIGVVYRIQGQYGEALAIYEETLVIRQEVGDRTGEGETYSNIGAVYQSQGRYDAALASYEQALSIHHEVGNRTGEGTTYNNIGVVYRIQGRYDNALANYEEALAIRLEVGDRPGEGKTRNNIGAVYLAQGRHEEALVNFKHALAIHQEIGNRASEGTTLVNIGTVYDNQGQYEEALASFEQALSVLHEVGDRAGEGTTYNNIGAVYLAQGRYNEALTNFVQALSIRRAVGDLGGEGETLNNLGAVYFAQGRYNEALATHEQALSILRELGQRRSEGATLTNISGVYRAQGRYGAALAGYEQALVILQTAGDLRGQGITHGNIGVVYLAQGRYDMALANLEESLAILQRVGDRASEVTTLINTGTVYDNQGQYEEALASYEQALALAQVVGDLAEEATAYNNISSVQQAQGRYDEALAGYEQALALAQVVGDLAGEATAYNNIGVVQYALGKYDEALANYKQALAIMTRIGDRRSEGTILNNFGEVYNKLGRSRDALQAYTAGIELLEHVRSEAGNDRARISIANDFVAAYNRVITLYHEQGANDKAFWYSERSRARMLLDSMSTGQVQLHDNEATALLVAEQEAHAARQSAQDVLAKAYASNPPDPTRVHRAEAELRSAERAYQQAADAIAKHSDRLASLIPGSQQVPQLEQVQLLLDADTTLLSYWMLEEKTLVFLVTTDKVSIFELPNVTFNNVLTALLELFTWPNKENPHPRPLRKLYQWLLYPLAPHLTTTHITIIPHSLLHYVPFAALTDGNEYFVERHTLSLLPSASILPFLAQNAEFARSNPSQHAVVFGNPTTTEIKLPPLIHAAGEAQAIAALLGTTAYTATAASETQLRISATKASIIHLAAHGGYNPFNPLYSLIVLAGDKEQDGRLETHEVFGLSLQGSDLVVLSACQTNIGYVSLGDDMVSLTRAFFFAGTPTVVSSLWQVDDAATKTLMVAFYHHWKEEGMSKAAALQAAQADVRADPRWASPYYWAGFVLNGYPGTPSKTTQPE